MSNLEYLEELTRQLPPVPSLMSITDHITRLKSTYTIKNSSAVAEAKSLINDGLVAVADISIPKGAEFAEHVHEMDEVIVVVTGSLLVKQKEAWLRVKAGQSLVTPAGIPHEFKYDEPSRVVAITVPPDMAFPGADLSGE